MINDYDAAEPEPEEEAGVLEHKDGYESKYLKYKNKYLQLKKQMK